MEDSGAENPKAAKYYLVLVVVACAMALSCWFSTNAVAPALEDEEGYSSGELAWLSSSVMVGFVIGTFVLSVGNVADLLGARTLFALGAGVASVSNLGVAWLAPKDVGGMGALVPLRALTGAALGAVYPPAMKIVAGWFVKNRGLAIGIMVGALTIGSGSPHILRSVFTSAWRSTLYISSSGALIAALIVKLLVRDGPFGAPAAPFQPTLLLLLFSEPAPRLALLGYVYHMWELYSVWASIGAFYTDLYDDAEIGALGGIRRASFLAFLFFLAGAVGCVAGGVLAEKYGRTLVTAFSLATSSICAAIFGFLPTEADGLLVVVSLIWGATIVSDSAQFSTAITELCPPESRGTLLTISTSVGFLIAAITVRSTPAIQAETSWGVAFLILAIGPALGVIVMLRLRYRPEAQAMANGKR